MRRTCPSLNRVCLRQRLQVHTVRQDLAWLSSVLCDLRFPMPDSHVCVKWALSAPDSSFERPVSSQGLSTSERSEMDCGRWASCYLPGDGQGLPRVF